MVEYNAKADLVEKAQMYKNCAISIGGEVAPEDVYKRQVRPFRSL